SALVAADEWDLGRLKALAAATRAGSICGLGQAAPTPVECVVRYFPHELMP
ncbi:MAG TPA: NADH-ubiquinone oxidoreductase-F iron-sulfur binding region domain-containing protein, partial [Albitalea sp.]